MKTPAHNNLRAYHELIFDKLGIDTTKPYEICVDKLIHLHLDALKQIEMNNKDNFRQEIKRILKPNN